MKFSAATATAILASTVFAAPAAPAPAVDVSKVDFSKITYPKGTGENLASYPAPPGGWESVKYPPGTGANLPSYPAPPGGWENVKYPPGTGSQPAPAPVPVPAKFTSSFHVRAVGAQVRNGTTPAPGPANAVGIYDLKLDSTTNTICFAITLENVVGAYSSPARTATHIHEAARGASGPPRIAFPNPVGDDKRRYVAGCLKGPFTTGVQANGADSGTGFHVSQIEKNPAGFFADSHTALFTLGVVRGQLA